ncbi:MAG: response regulator, partial [Longimicrobiales bacterium]|nr:response regulator [Longimicrobiales bacterium]
GAIEVASEPGEGSTVALWFPAAERRAEAELEESVPVEEGEPVTGRVLLVEDDSSVRRVARAILERAGFDVVPFSSAEAGLEALEGGRNGFDIVLSDLVLPGMKGREFLDRVGERAPEIPLVAMSGYAEGSPGRRGDLPSAIYFVQKPFTAEDLVETLRTALVQKRH